MSEHEYRAMIEPGRRDCKETLLQCRASRDCWKFLAVTFFILSLLCLLELYGCLPDLN